MEQCDIAKRVGNLVRELIAERCINRIEPLQKTARTLLQNRITKLDDLACVELEDLNGIRALPAECVAFIQKNIAFATNKAKAAGRLGVQASNKKMRHNGASMNVMSAQVIANILQGMQLCVIDREAKGPLAASTSIATSFRTVMERNMWIEHSRIESLCCSTKRSIGSTRSALKCWMQFAVTCLGVPEHEELPPSIDGLIVWGRLFKNKDTYANYVSRLRLVCQIAGVCTSAFEDLSLARVKRGIGATAAAPKPKRFIGQDLLKSLVATALSENDHIQATLYCVCYAFLLRVPSEGLPMVFGGIISSDAVLPLGEGAHSCLSGNEGTLTLQLARRKNKQHGSTLVRHCWCKTCPTTCPVHMCMRYLINPMHKGQGIFRQLSPHDVTCTLRRRLAKLRVKHADEFRSHDFRRGHARDLQRNGARLGEILKAGEWSSPAFLKYLDLDDLEANVVVEAHVNESNED